MAAIILPHRWKRQPAYPVEINWGNPLATGLIFLWNPQANADAARRLILPAPTAAGTGAARVVAPRSNVARRNTAANNSYIDLTSTSLGALLAGQKATLLHYLKVGSDGWTGGSQFGFDNITTSGNYSHYTYSGTAYINTFRVDRPSFSADILADPHIVAVTADQGAAGGSGDWNFYQNGNVKYNSTFSWGIDTAQRLWGNEAGSFTLNFDVHLTAIYNRALSSAEINAYVENPWQVFAPIRRRIYLPSAAAGGDITGTAALLEAPDTVSSSATVQIAAAAAIVEARDTIAAAVTVSVTANASITEAADYLSASGGAAAFVTAAIVEAADSIASAATVAITATSALVERADTSGGAGTVSITATAAITERPDTIASDGGSASFVTAAILERADSLSATGTVAVVGIAAITEAADALTSVASVSVTGTASIVEASDLLSASGSVASNTRTASAAILEAGDIIVSGVTVLVTGSAAITEQPDTIEASSAQVRFADAAIVEAPDYITATVVQKIARRIAASDALGHRIAGSDSTAWRITPSDGLN